MEILRFSLATAGTAGFFVTSWSLALVISMLTGGLTRRMEKKSGSGEGSCGRTREAQTSPKRTIALFLSAGERG
jgi:hypothetical protein